LSSSASASADDNVDDTQLIVGLVARVFYPGNESDSADVTPDSKRARPVTAATAVESRSDGRPSIYAHAYEENTAMLVASYLPRSYTVWVANFDDHDDGPSGIDFLNDRIWDNLQQPLQSVMPITFVIADRGGPNVESAVELLVPTRDIVSRTYAQPSSPTPRMRDYRVRANVFLSYDIGGIAQFDNLSEPSRAMDVDHITLLHLWKFRCRSHTTDSPDKLAALREFTQSRQIFSMAIQFGLHPNWCSFRYGHALVLNSGDWDRISHLGAIGYTLPTPEELARNTPVWHQFNAYRAELGARLRRLSAAESRIL
jgi:hypothetical protein